MSLKWGYKGRGLRKNSRQSATGKTLGRIIFCLLRCVWPLTVLEGVRWYVVREFFLVLEFDHYSGPSYCGPKHR